MRRLINRNILNVLLIMLSLLLPSCGIGSSSETNSTTTASSLNTNIEPQYQLTIDIPAITTTNAKLVTRFYQPWGNGDIVTGWQQPIQAPSVTLNGESLNTVNFFSYAESQSFNTGALGLGTDEYAQYFVTTLPSTSESGEIIISGEYPQAAYISATVYSYSGGDTGTVFSWQIEKFDYDFTTLNNIPNPYITGNPSVFAYVANNDIPLPPSQLGSTSISTNTQILNEISTKNSFSVADQTKLSQLEFLKSSEESTNGGVDVYRLDKYTSTIGMADDIATDGCSQSYLFAQLNESANQQVAILRIKVPTTFINSNSPDTTFGDYQVRYFSVSANVDQSKHQMNPLSFWTVNARMMEQYKDSNGYAYIFFAPNDYVQSIAESQNTPVTEPPVITWGNYKGYLLGYPDYAIIMRYKANNSSWQGSPASAKCYLTPSNNQPVNETELGDYTPEIFADSMDNFNMGNIGSVNMNNQWPTN